MNKLHKGISNNKILTISLASMFLFAACSNRETVVTEQTNYDFLRGLNKYQKDDKEKALAHYLAAYQKEANNPIILREIAYLYTDIGNIEQAKIFYDNSLKYEPNNSIALDNMVKIYIAEGNYAEAQKYLSYFVDKNSESYLKSALVLKMRQNDARETKMIMDRLLQKENFLKKSPGKDILNFIEKNYSQQEQFIIYKNFFENNKNEDSGIRYAELLYRKGDKKEAVRIFKLIAAETESKKALKNLYEIYKKENNTKLMKEVEILLHK